LGYSPKEDQRLKHKIKNNLVIKIITFKQELEVVLRKIKRPPKVSLSKFVQVDRVLYMQLFPGLFSILMVYFS
jgi:hypothetical protein